MTSKIFSS